MWSNSLSCIQGIGKDKQHVSGTGFEELKLFWTTQKSLQANFSYKGKQRHPSLFYQEIKHKYLALLAQFLLFQP